MTGSSNGKVSRTAEAAVARRRAGMVGGLRKLATAPGATTRAPAGPGTADGERCDLCGRTIGEDHRHLLELHERRIECACEPCWAMRSGEDRYRPVGTRVMWLDDLDLSDERWAAFGIPIGLAFFMRSTISDGVVSMYPSPAGATESQLDLTAWDALVEDNPVLRGLESDTEGLIVDRKADPHRHAIAPIDECYKLVGLVKASWEGISGGAALEGALDSFFDELRARAQA
jgi:Family of unknown function (DUF5947)